MRHMVKPVRSTASARDFPAKAYSFPRAEGNFYPFPFDALIYYGNKLAERQRRVKRLAYDSCMESTGWREFAAGLLPGKVP
jgi:hypothetical protein